MTTRKPRKPKEEVALAPVVVVNAQDLPVQQAKESTSVETFIQQAIQNNVPVETMERLLAMRKELKAEHAKEAFTVAMARFQAQCPVIVKTKEVPDRNGNIAYRYAPIESIVSQVKSALDNNGFSYSTNMKLLEDGVSVVVRVTHILGHSEETEMTVPFGTKTQIMSQSQVAAAATTFAKRYAFLNAFGILTGDEDNDGADLSNTLPQQQAPKELPADNPVVQDYKKKLENAKSMDELQRIWADMPVQAKNALKDVKDEVKAMISSENKA